MNQQEFKDVIEKVDIDLDSGTANIHGNEINDDEIIAAIKSVGFSIKK